ncbi:hypothetical protein D3C78_1629560 [compost metagenome]
MRIAHEPLGNHLGVYAAHGGQRLRDLQPRHAHAERARDQLEIDQTLGRGQHAPVVLQQLRQRFGCLAAQWQQMLLHPVGQRQL